MCLSCNGNAVIRVQINRCIECTCHRLCDLSNVLSGQAVNHVTLPGV
jgi:hypothetical protein